MPGPDVRRPLWSSLLAAALTTVLAGCSGAAQTEKEPVQAPPTPLSAYDTSGLRLERTNPCQQLTGAQATDAVGNEPDEATTWVPGKKLPGSSEVGEEWGCSLTGSGVTARAWVFAPPVSAHEAERLVKDHPDGCTAESQTDTFGDPGVARRCVDSTVLAGLVGDVWLTCEVSGDDFERTGRWCVSVMESLAGD